MTQSKLTSAWWLRFVDSVEYSISASLFLFTVHAITVRVGARTLWSSALCKNWLTGLLNRVTKNWGAYTTFCHFLFSAYRDKETQVFILNINLWGSIRKLIWCLFLDSYQPLWLMFEMFRHHWFGKRKRHLCSARQFWQRKLGNNFEIQAFISVAQACIVRMTHHQVVFQSKAVDAICKDISLYTWRKVIFGKRLSNRSVFQSLVTAGSVTNLHGFLR